MKLLLFTAILLGFVYLMRNFGTHHQPAKVPSHTHNNTPEVRAQLQELEVEKAKTLKLLTDINNSIPNH